MAQLGLSVKFSTFAQNRLFKIAHIARRMPRLHFDWRLIGRSMFPEQNQRVQRFPHPKARKFRSPERRTAAKQETLTACTTTLGPPSIHPFKNWQTIASTGLARDVYWNLLRNTC